MRFMDSDRCIEEKEGKLIADFFKEKGEEYFRGLERDFVERGHEATGCVVACGGGMVSVAGMMELLKERGVVITLAANLETILKRVVHRDTRPLLNVENKEDVVRELLGKREKVYLTSGNVVVTDGRTLNDIVKHVQRVYADRVKPRRSVCS